MDKEDDQVAERLSLREVGYRYQEYAEGKNTAVPGANQDELSWFEKNFEQLLEQYDGQWLAIYRDGVV
ncbi:MAG TPA: hypothetical protein VMW83_10400, partial [Spirochaetia bacterium]|nr:hypothetical protein [Spirochaetia bacterium]